MALTVPLVSGEFLMLQYILGMKSINTTMTASSTQGPVLHLYSNDPSINNSTVVGDLTEVSATGYAPKTCISSGWTTVQSVGISTGLYSMQTFTFSTGPASIYGYWVSDTTGALLWAERMSGAPFVISTSGTISISLRISLA